MHLGVNLQKAFLDGSVSGFITVRNQRQYHQTDSMVHEFCKIFGKYGVPEYGCGVTGFPAFLQLMCQNDKEDKAHYYKKCIKISLDRQVRSRYFVTASNSGKLLFLQQAAIDYLQYIDKSKGNKLEQRFFKNYKTLMKCHR